MSENKSNKKLIVRAVVLCILLGLMAFTYRQLYLSYLVMEKSNQISELLLQRQIMLLQVKDQELSSAKNTLKETEFLVSQLQTENDKLREQVKVMDKVVELEGTISRLKEKNTQLEDQIANLKDLDPNFDETVKTLQDGRKWLAKYSQWIHKVKGRIRGIKQDDFDKKVAAQKERDRVQSLLGNNGFTTKDGQLLPREIPSSPSQNVKIDVRFVK